MLNLDQIRLKAEAFERSAAEVDGESAAALRELAMQWRLLEVQAIYMEAIQPPEATDGGAPS